MRLPKHRNLVLSPVSLLYQSPAQLVTALGRPRLLMKNYVRTGNIDSLRSWPFE